MTIKTILAALVAAFTISAQAADETYVSLPLTSYHLSSSTIPQSAAQIKRGDKPRPYNANNTGLAFGQRWQTEGGLQLGYVLGFYDNSYYRRSNFVAAEVGYRFNEYVRAGVLAGVISGYGGNATFGDKIGPLIAPQVEVKVYKNVSTTFTFVPTTIPNGSNAIALQLNYTFK